MKPLTNHPELNATLGLVAAHAKITSLATPIKYVENEDTAHNMFMRSHVSDCCGSIVHHDLEMPYCAACGDFCQPVVQYGQVK